MQGPHSRRAPATLLAIVAAAFAAAAFAATAFAATAFAAPSAAAPAAAAPLASSVTTAELEALAASFYPAGAAGAPGAAVLIAQGDRILLEKGYGFASVELGVPLAPDMVFRLGSVTKQFTAVAVLMLAEQGKLRLDQTIADFLPDYPQPQAGQIQIRHLLSHTSGIPNYTDDGEFWKIAKETLEPSRMLGLFAGKPLEFAPGARFEYSNSGYWVLGLIVEKASGQSYRDFIEQQVFAKAGMKASFYDDPEKLIPRRAAGHQLQEDGGYAPAPYIDMSGPFAAGALASTTEDLRRWHEALLAGRLISRESLEKAWTPFTFDDGKKSGYGFGWTTGEYEGHRIVSHGGGIPGFTAYLLLLPEEKITVTVLSNGAPQDPEFVAQRLLMFALGKERSFKTIELPEKTLARFEGVYQIGANSRRVVKAGKDHITTQRDEGRILKAFPISSTEFLYEGQNDRIQFELDEKGEVAAMRMLQWGGAPGEPAPRTDEKVPEDPKFIELTAAQMDQLLGSYELHPGFVLHLRREGVGLIVQATGQGPNPIEAVSPTELHSPGIGLRLVFQLEGGKAKSLTLYQGGAEMPAKRID